MKPIRTIGHSNHPIDRFVGLLRAAGIALLVDVRSMPYSRRFPQFGKERLAKSLAEAGIAYVHEGAALGGKPAGGDDYDALAERPAFKEALGRLIERADETTLCLMCAEKGAARLPPHRAGVAPPGGARRLDRSSAGGRRHAPQHREVEETLLARKGGPDLFDGDPLEDRAARLARAWQARERAMRRS